MSKDVVKMDEKPYVAKAKRTRTVKENNRSVMECSTCGEMFYEGNSCKCDSEDRKWSYVQEEY